MIGCFAVFIVACGATHLLDVVTVWHPIYWVSGVVKAITAAASVSTAILLVKMVPAALRWPSPKALHDANQQLQLANTTLRAQAARPLCPIRALDHVALWDGSADRGSLAAQVMTLRQQRKHTAALTTA